MFGTISASNQEAFSGDYHIIEPDYIVRRLTRSKSNRYAELEVWIFI